MNQVSRTLLLAALIACASGCSVSSDAKAAQGDERRIYHLHYVVTLDRQADGARVELTLAQDDDYLREIDMPLGDGRISDVQGDGDFTIDEDRAVWLPPDDGGRLSWFVRINHVRGDEHYDAFVAADWALFRAEDIIPSANTRTLKGSRSDTRLTFRLPKGWSSVTPYFGKDDSYAIDNPGRRFDTPTGWVVLGDLGVRNETISGIRTKVAGPTGHDLRRLDILALLRWTLPELLRVLPDFPERLTIVGAGERMWRGALSAPGSLYIHADRPLISENGTSTLLHETVHVGMGLSAARGADWIVEGFAEYYGLQILRRSGTISSRRFDIAREDLRQWGRETSELCGHVSTGSRTARAVTVLGELDTEIRERTDGRSSLDDVLAELAKLDEKITVDRLRDIAAEVAGESVDALDDANLPGCQER
jgi:hypothetical protein